MSKKYVVYSLEIETKNGKGAEHKFYNSDTYPVIEGVFDTIEEARNEFNSIQTEVIKMGGWCGSYYRHFCKYIEENEYNEDGEFVTGGDIWESKFPDYEEPEDEEDEE